MTRDPLAWDGDRPPWARQQKRRIVRRSVITGLLMAAALAWGIFWD